MRNALPVLTLPLILAAGALAIGAAHAEEEGPVTEAVRGGQSARDRADVMANWRFAVDPKPLSDAATRGLDWLVQVQAEDGGWSQGDESRHMGGGGALATQTNVADTCAATLALIRASDNTCRGTYEQPIARGLAYICKSVQNSDTESLFVTDIRGTRVQSKLGQFVDTFLSAIVLAEAKGRMADPELNTQIDLCLQRVVSKIEAHQGEDGRFQNGGWAPTLSQAMASKGLNRAAQAGEEVAADSLNRAREFAASQFDMDAGDFSRDGAAGVELYAAAATVGALRDAENTDAGRIADLVAETESDDPDVQAKARAELTRIDESMASRKNAEAAVINRLQDKQFIAGFGSNGGEEFLSYLNIAEGLVVAGGENWTTWDKSMTENLEQIQNPDGSWTGHHCITGRTFCTSSALLVLLADRTPVPAEALDIADDGDGDGDGEVEGAENGD